jgi:predicted transcriptional regulator with HTH domain
MTNAEIAKERAPIYILFRDDDYLRIMLVTYHEDVTGERKTEYKSLLNLELFQHWRQYINYYQRLTVAEQIDHSFYTLIMILTAGEEEQRIFHRRITDNNTRNIRYQVEQPRKYLKTSLERAIKQEFFSTNTKEKRKLPKKLIDKLVRESIKMLFPTPAKFDELITCAIQSTKDEMGFPEADPVEYSYLVTDAVVAAATSEPCKEYLKEQKHRVAIFPSELNNIIHVLNSKYTADAELVIAKIKETKSREHIAAFSITSEKDQTLLSTVNMQRQYIRMEAWKFLALVERAGESLRLTELSKPKMGEPPPLFKFNNNTEGTVVGKFDIQKSIIEVVCLNEGKEPYLDKATFVVDSTYTMCIYATLKRLKDDAERFKRWREDAQTLLKVNDPFVYVHQPLTTSLPE